MLQTIKYPKLQTSQQRASTLPPMHVPVSGVFEVRTADNEVQEHSRGWLWRRAGDVRRSLAENSKAGTGTDEALAQEVYDKTMKEVSNEWAFRLTLTRRMDGHSGTKEGPQQTVWHRARQQHCVFLLFRRMLGASCGVVPREGER